MKRLVRHMGSKDEQDLPYPEGVYLTAITDLVRASAMGRTGGDAKDTEESKTDMVPIDAGLRIV